MALKIFGRIEQFHRKFERFRIESPKYAEQSIAEDNNVALRRDEIDFGVKDLLFGVEEVQQRLPADLQFDLDILSGRFRGIDLFLKRRDASPAALGISPGFTGCG